MIQGRQWQIRKRKRREWIKRILLVTAGMGIVLCMEQGKRLWDGISARDTEEAGEQEAVEASAVCGRKPLRKRRRRLDGPEEM